MDHDPSRKHGMTLAAHHKAALRCLFGEGVVCYAEGGVDSEWAGKGFGGADKGEGGARDEGTVHIDTRRAREERIFRCVLHLCLHKAPNRKFNKEDGKH